MKSLNVKLLVSIFSILIIVFVVGSAVSASPVSGEEYKFRQPDGSKVTVRIFGDEYYQRVESLDGYTLIRDPKGKICYAKLDANGNFTSTGKVYTGDTLSLAEADSLGLKKGLSEDTDVVLNQVKEKKKELAMNAPEEAAALAPTPTPTPLAKGVPVFATATPSKVVGLVILIDFPDVKSSVTASSIEQGINAPGTGSVYDHFYNISGQKLQFTNKIIGFYTAKNNKNFYDSGTGYGGSTELLKETLNWLNTSGTDFSPITLNPDKSIMALTLLYAGTADAGWANGLWPHSGGYNYTLSNGIRINSHQFSSIGSRPQPSAMTHECEHMILKWPDYYDYDGDSKVIGNFNTFANPHARCVMSKFYQIKWLNGLPDGTVVTIPAGTRDVYGFVNTVNNNEMFIIENIRKRGDWTRFPGEGLVVWHIDTKGNNNYQDMTLQKHYITSIEQADGKFDMEKNINSGDTGDFFRAGFRDKFGDTTAPNSKWWNGSSSGFNISNISAIGDNMTFVISSTSSPSSGTPTITITPTQTPTPLPPQKDPVCIYKFDETSGTAAIDSSGKNTAASLVGATWTAGKWGNAINLNGAEQYALLPKGVVSTLDNMTIASWVKLDTLSNWARIFDFGNDTSTYMFMIPQSSSNTYRFAITTAGSGNEEIIEGGTALSTGTWLHVAVTLQGNTGILYLNGKEVGRSSGITLRPMDLGVTSLNYIGKSQYNDPYFDGQVDDFRIYNRALPASEISELASTPAATISISGYIKADINSNSKDINSGFRVEVSGTGASTITDENGYFSITGLPSISGSYTLKISKTGYLKRTIPDIPGGKNSQIGSSASPTPMWCGDFPVNGVQDDYINMSDIMQVASFFNTIAGDGKYDPLYDINKDSSINFADIMTVANYFSKGSVNYPAAVVS